MKAVFLKTLLKGCLECGRTIDPCLKRYGLCSICERDKELRELHRVNPLVRMTKKRLQGAWKVQAYFWKEQVMDAQAEAEAREIENEVLLKLVKEAGLWRKFVKIVERKPRNWKQGPKRRGTSKRKWQGLQESTPCSRN